MLKLALRIKLMVSEITKRVRKLRSTVQGQCNQENIVCNKKKKRVAEEQESMKKQCKWRKSHS